VDQAVHLSFNSLSDAHEIEYCCTLIRFNTVQCDSLNCRRILWYF